MVQDTAPKLRFGKVFYNRGVAKDSNALSVATAIHYKKFTLFTGGDLTGGGASSPNIESA